MENVNKAIKEAYVEAANTKATTSADSYIQFDHERKNEYGNKSEKSLGMSTSNYYGPDNLIPLLSIFGCTGWCADIVYLNAHPSDWRLGGTCNPCCFTCPPFWLWTCNFLQLSDVQGECCIIWDWSIREVMPRACVDNSLDLLFVGIKCVAPREADYETASVPCLFNVGGCNICLDGNFRFGFLQSIKTLKEGQWCCVACPCVLGSLNNCQILFDCCAAMQELWDGKKTKKSEKKLETEEVTDAEKYKAEIMLRDGADVAKEEAIKFAKGLGNKGKEQGGKTRTDDLYPWLGLCCLIQSCFCKFPDFLGGFQECGIIGFNQSCTCCKPLIVRGHVFTGDIFLCCQSRFAFACPRTLLNCICQYGCTDIRCAIPCDGKDVPCLVNLLFVNFCYNWRPTFHCTYFAPLAQFKDDYEGQKYTVCDMFCIAWKACCHVLSASCTKPDTKKTDGPSDVAYSKV